MREEQVTKAILKWLLDNNWEIVCFDFPQSGTGRLLHPNIESAHKNRGAINPDIIAVRNSVCLFFENKDRFYLPDYEKLHSLIIDNHYTDDIELLTKGNNIEEYYFGIGLPALKHGKGSRKAAHLVHFIIGVREDNSINILHNPEKLNFV